MKLNLDVITSDVSASVVTVATQI